MKRFSAIWWIIIAADSVVVAGVAFFLLSTRTDLGSIEMLATGLVIVIIADLAVALGMEAVAPTRVSVGPGERRSKRDDISEVAVITGEFDASGRGRVSVRGETWSARIEPSGRSLPPRGSKVRVVGREGLDLIVSVDADR